VVNNPSWFVEEGGATTIEQIALEYTRNQCAVKDNNFSRTQLVNAFIDGSKHGNKNYSRRDMEHCFNESRAENPLGGSFGFKYNTFEDYLKSPK